MDRFQVNAIIFPLCFLTLMNIGCEKSNPMMIEITEQPKAGSVCWNGQYDLSITASCSSDLHYQWEQLSGSVWVQVGDDSPTYRTNPLGSTITYRAFIYSSDAECQSVYSDEAIVTVVDSISILYQPASNLLFTGGSITLYVLPKGPTDLHYQWEALDSNTWVMVGNDEDKLVVANLQRTTTFRVQISTPIGGCTTKYSDEAVIRVPSIESIIGDYTGICYIETSSLNNMTGEVILGFDTMPADITVHLVDTIGNSGYMVDVGEPSVLYPYFITIDDLTQDTIYKFAHWSHLSQRVTWIPLAKEMITVYKDEGISQYHYFRRKCFYQKI